MELDHDRAPIRIEVEEDDLNSLDGLSETGKFGKTNTDIKKKGAAPSVISAKTLSSYGGSTKSSVSILGFSPIPT